jgi:N-acetylmuramoyl-L-alanine amidase/AmpD protein
MKKTIEGFLDRHTHVSAHFIVGKDGRVVQMVRVEKRAWHAGISTLSGAPHVNDYSVGIEIINKNNGHDPYPLPQIEAVAGIIRFLRSRYNIPDARIVSHESIALPPGRKSDPRGLNFDLIRKLSRPDAGVR